MAKFQASGDIPAGETSFDLATTKIKMSGPSANLLWSQGKRGFGFIERSQEHRVAKAACEGALKRVGAGIAGVCFVASAQPKELRLASPPTGRHFGGV